MSEHITRDDAKQILEDYWEHKFTKEAWISEMTNLFFKVDALDLIVYVWGRCCEDKK